MRQKYTRATLYNSTVSTWMPTPSQNRPTAVSERQSLTGSRRERTGSHLAPRRSSKRQTSPSRSTRNSHAAPISTRAAKVSCSMAVRILRPFGHAPPNWYSAITAPGYQLAPSVSPGCGYLWGAI
ncbi:hypothetical protein PS645_04249 [Pseudomonas fluorescens]|uniref:Uncharacterized protein n=1 Tax=Pseudomonas fluorescens TaxID=294 RepID=A0A5E6VW16_PSEFL|nr:hypothetical protein PS645_04249 [Pseudomonas fluorescens]